MTDREEAKKVHERVRALSLACPCCGGNVVLLLETVDAATSDEKLWLRKAADFKSAGQLRLCRSEDLAQSVIEGVLRFIDVGEPQG